MYVYSTIRSMLSTANYAIVLKAGGYLVQEQSTVMVSLRSSQYQ